MELALGLLALVAVCAIVLCVVMYRDVVWAKTECKRILEMTGENNKEKRDHPVRGR
jgi:hypothetical protein